MNAMKTENASREQKVNNGEIIYGVKEYTYSSYHTYTYSNMQIDTREVLGKKGNALYADDKELKTWYESVKQERYPKFDTMKFDYYKINWTDDITTDKASSLMQKARKEFIEQGSYNVGNVQYIHLTIDDDNASDLQKTSPIFFETIQKMKVGDVTEVISENASSFFAVLKSTKKAGYKDFEEHKSAIYTEYIDEKYEGFVDNRVKSAKVEKTDKLKYLKMD